MIGLAILFCYILQQMASSGKILARNRKAFHDYEIGKREVAGLVLTGAEVKSTRLGGAKLAGSYVVFKGEEAYLVGAHIASYKPAALSDYDPTRSRKLLLAKKELQSLRGTVEQAGVSLVPLEIIAQGKFLKLVFAVGKGKKKAEKKRAKKEKDIMRDAERTIKQRLRH